MSYDNKLGESVEKQMSDLAELRAKFSGLTRQQLRAEQRAAKKAAARKPDKRKSDKRENARLAAMVAALSKEFVGKINTYNCPLGCQIVTVDIHPGITPMRIACQSCRANGMVSGMLSSGYACDQDLTPTHAWRRPPFNSWHTFPKETQEHLMRGGLELYKIDKM